MFNVLKYSKSWLENDDILIYRYHTGTGNKFNLIMRMTVHGQHVGLGCDRWIQLVQLQYVFVLHAIYICVCRRNCCRLVGEGILLFTMYVL